MMSDQFTRFVLIALIGILFLRGRSAHPLIFSLSPHRAGILLIIALGFALRAYGITFDFPGSYHHDERWKVAAIQRMFDAGSINPHYFLHPSLLLNLTALVHLVFAPLLSTFSDEQALRLSGRIVSCVAGTATIPVLYLIIKKLLNQEIAWMSALVLAVNPMHITASRYLKEDALLVFFTTACLWGVIHTRTSKTRKSLVFTGMCLGFSIGSKYAGLIAAPFLFLLTPSHAVFAGFIAVISFFASTPGALLTPHEFLDGVLYEQRHMIVGNSVPITFFSQWGLYQWIRGILPSFTLIGAAFIPFALGWLSKTERQVFFLFSLILICFYLPGEVVNAKIEPQPERYILPAVPFLCSLVGLGVILISKRFAIPLLAPLMLIIIMLPTMLSISELTNDTREKMKAYIELNIPRGSKLLLDHRFNNPKLSESYDVQYINVRPLIKGYPEELNPDRLKARGIQYVLLSEHTYRCVLFCKESPGAPRRAVMRMFRRFLVQHQELPRFQTFGFHNPVLTLFDLSREAGPRPPSPGRNPFFPIPAPPVVENDGKI